MHSHNTSQRHSVHWRLIWGLQLAVMQVLWNTTLTIREMGRESSLDRKPIKGDWLIILIRSYDSQQEYIQNFQGLVLKNWPPLTYSALNNYKITLLGEKIWNIWEAHYLFNTLSISGILRWHLNIFASYRFPWSPVAKKE